MTGLPVLSRKAEGVLPGSLTMPQTSPDEAKYRTMTHPDQGPPIRRKGSASDHQPGTPAVDEELALMDRWWRAANCLVTKPAASSRARVFR